MSIQLVTMCPNYFFCRHDIISPSKNQLKKNGHLLFYLLELKHLTLDLTKQIKKKIFLSILSLLLFVIVNDNVVEIVYFFFFLLFVFSMRIDFMR